MTPERILENAACAEKEVQSYFAGAKCWAHAHHIKTERIGKNFRYCGILLIVASARGLAIETGKENGIEQPTRLLLNRNVFSSSH